MSGGVPDPRGYVAGHSGVVSSVFMCPELAALDACEPVAPFRMSSKVKPSQSVKWGGSASRRPPVC